ncbi:MAG: DEAD/DEAH box helicase [Desulfobacteraceae bacterium]|nr:DEAD/DEAH box helicase [Desulfobacteraceae bacterium]
MKITIKNNLLLTDVSPEMEKDLITRLTLANPKWIENNRLGRWNKGTPKEIKCFDRFKGKLWIPRGYLRQLILMCRKQSITYTLDDQRKILPMKDYSFKGTLKPFQQKAVNIMLSRDFGTLSAPTGSGKTVMALNMMAKRRQPTLIVVHTKDLANQWRERAAEFLDISTDRVGFIGSGKKTSGELVSVALVQSLYKCAEEISHGIGFLIVDECHRCPSRTFTEAVSAFDCRYMLGLSATPWRRDELSKLIFWYLGDVHHEVEKKQLVESGDILAAEVHLRMTDFVSYADPVNDYSKMLSELTLNDERNRMIAMDIARETQLTEDICLVLSDRKKHCETLHVILKYKHNIESALLTGDLSMDERQAVLVRLENKEVKVLIATGQLIGEGFDNKRLTTLFLATPIKFSGRLLQYVGRILRPAEGKGKPRIYDYVDAKIDVLVASAKARQRIYGTF